MPHMSKETYLHVKRDLKETPLLTLDVYIHDTRTHAHTHTHTHAHIHTHRVFVLY